MPVLCCRRLLVIISTTSGNETDIAANDLMGNQSNSHFVRIDADDGLATSLSLNSTRAASSRGPACRATSLFSLPRAYPIGRPAVRCGVVLPVCPRVSCRSPTSTGPTRTNCCGHPREDVTRKMLPWNVGSPRGTERRPSASTAQNPRTPRLCVSQQLPINIAARWRRRLSPESVVRIYNVQETSRNKSPGPADKQFGHTHTHARADGSRNQPRHQPT